MSTVRDVVERARHALAQKHEQLQQVRAELEAAGRRTDEFKGMYAEGQARLGEMAGQLEAAQKEVVRLAALLESSRAEAAAMTSEAEMATELRRDLAVADEAARALARQLEEAQAAIAALERKAELDGRAVAALTEENDNLADTLRQQTLRAESAERRAADLEAELIEERRRAKAQAEAQALREAEIQVIVARFGALEQDSAELGKMRTEQEFLRAEIVRRNKEFNVKLNEIKTLRAEVAELSNKAREKDRLAEQLKAHAAKIDELGIELVSCHAETERLKQELIDTTAMHAELSEEIERREQSRQERENHIEQLILEREEDKRHGERLMLAIEELEIKKRALESGIEAEREKSAELAEENKKLVNTQEYLRSDLVHWRSEVQKLTLERDSMQGGGNEHRGRLAEVENIIADALATVDALLVNKSPADEE